MIPADKIVCDCSNVLNDFLNRVVDDPRIGPLHISLFVAMLYMYDNGDRQIPVAVFGKALMKQAKISSRDTYSRYMQELHNYGYIYYIPSYNPLLGSLIYPLKLDSK